MKKSIFITIAVLALVVSLPISYQFIFAERNVSLLEEILWIIFGLLLTLIPLISLFLTKNFDNKSEKLKKALLVLNLIIVVISAALLYIEIKSGLQESIRE